MTPKGFNSIDSKCLRGDGWGKEFQKKLDQSSVWIPLGHITRLSSLIKPSYHNWIWVPPSFPHKKRALLKKNEMSTSMKLIRYIFMLIYFTWEALITVVLGAIKKQVTNQGILFKIWIWIQTQKAPQIPLHPMTHKTKGIWIGVFIVNRDNNSILKQWAPRQFSKWTAIW